MKKLIQRILFGQTIKGCPPIGVCSVRTVSNTSSTLYEVSKYDTPTGSKTL